MRFIDVHHGPYLSAYFESSSDKSDRKSDRLPNQILRMSDKSYINMLKYRVSLDIFEMDLLRSVIYGASWIFKIIAYILIHLSIKAGSVKKGTCYFVLIS